MPPSTPCAIEGLDPTLKAERAARFHDETLGSLMELVAATGHSSPHDIGPERILRRVEQHMVQSLAEIHHFETPSSLIEGVADEPLQRAFDEADPETFTPSKNPALAGTAKSG